MSSIDTPSNKAAASRRKGKRGETEVAATLKAQLGDPTISRNLRQHQQAGQGDIVGDLLKHFHVEVKRRATPRELQLNLWLQQATLACEHAETEKIPVVVARTDRDDWSAYVRLSLPELAWLISARNKRPE